MAPDVQLSMKLYEARAVLAVLSGFQRLSNIDIVEMIEDDFKSRGIRDRPVIGEDISDLARVIQRVHERLFDLLEN